MNKHDAFFHLDVLWSLHNPVLIIHLKYNHRAFQYVNTKSIFPTAYYIYEHT